MEYTLYTAGMLKCWIHVFVNNRYNYSTQLPIARKKVSAFGLWYTRNHCATIYDQAQLWSTRLEDISVTAYAAVVCRTCSHICLFLIIHPVILTILAKIKHSSIAHYFENTARQKLISCGGKLTNPRLTFWYFYYYGPVFKASLRKPAPAA